MAGRISGRLGSIAALLLTALLAACGGGERAQHQVPVAIRKGDMCAVCGMYIQDHPGPRAEAYVEGSAVPLKFGSTRDFFAYVLQPDNASQLQSLYVQDSARIDWKHPSDAPQSFVDARKASYVAWQPLPGGMGPTLASFADPADARAFIAEYGGQLLSFGDVTPQLISALGYACPAPGQNPVVSSAPCKAASVRAGPGMAAPGSMPSGRSMSGPSMPGASMSGAARSAADARSRQPSR
jgi:copper chaperone NosL